MVEFEVFFECMAYLAVYFLVYAAIVHNSLWLSHLVNCLAVKTTYVLMTALESDIPGIQGWQDDFQVIVLSGIFMILYALMFGHMAEVMAYAVLMELFLFSIQFPIKSHPFSFKVLWVLSLLDPVFIPLEAALLAREGLYLGYPAGKAGVSSGPGNEENKAKKGIK